ncbi:MAG: ceramide glucosyltransferase, partial [Pseudorhodoplanes sp.]
ACTKIVRELGLRVRLMQPPVRQPLGDRRALDVWKRQSRWAQLRRASFPVFFALEILSGSVLPLVAVMSLALLAGASLVASAAAFLTTWYGAEWLMTVKVQWHHSSRTLLCCMFRDLMLPCLYLNGWFGRSFQWRGNDMRAVENARLS